MIYNRSFGVSKALFGTTDNCRASSRYHPFTEMQQPVDGIMMDDLLGASAPSASVNNLGKALTLIIKGFRKMSAFSSCFIYHAAAGFLGEMQPTPANFTNHFVTHNDIASAFNETGAGLRGGPKNPIDSMQFGEPFPEYQGGFTEPTLYSSVATMGNSLDDSLQTFMSEALYTNNLTQKEVDELSAAGITQVIFHFRLQLMSCNVLVPTVG